MKIGQNIHNSVQGADGKPRALSAEEKAKRLAILERVPGGNLWMDDIDSARDEKRRHPDWLTVHRWWRQGDGALYRTMSPMSFYDEYARFGDTGVVIQVMNEPTGYGAQGSQDDLEKIADWSAKLQDLFGAAGISLALPNFGEGHPDEKRLSELDAHWLALKKWQTLHYHAVHEYGTWRGMTYDDPADKADVYPWRVGRFKFTADYCQQHYGFIPNMLITEWGIDSAHDGTAYRGWRTTGMTGKAYAAALIQCVKDVYNYPYIKRLYVYCMMNTGERNTQSDWASFDTWGSDDYYAELEATKESLDMTFPLPTDPAWIAEENQSGAAYGVRQTRISADTTATIREHEKFWRYPNSEVENWIVVKAIGGQIGYCDRGVLTIAKPDPKPDVEPVTDLKASIEAVIASLSKNIGELESEVAALKMEQKDIENRLSDRNHSLVRLLDSRTILQLHLEKLAAKAA